MNKQQKIIVSIVGISIVLLALLGLTYAYYLTRIEGNTNTNSISITTADLKLVYGDGNGHVSKENIMPGTTIEKTFTVENTGDNTVNDYAVYLEELTNTLNRTEDLIYELTCESTGEDCNGGNGEFPQLAGIIATNSIEKDAIHTYTLKVTYINHENINQSEDMGSTISAFVQIYALKDILDIEGEVTGASEGDYAQINSVQKRSQIVDGKYKFAGVLPGTHTIKICSKDDTVCSNDTAKLKKEIVVNVGTIEGVSGNTITMTDDSQTASININLTGTTSVTIGTSLKKYNPFKEGTLAYNILNNAYNPLSSSSTKYSKNPLTIPGKETSAVKYIEGELSTEEETFKSYLGSTSKYYTYGDTYSYTSSNYTITNNDGSAVKAVQGFSSLKGKYITDLWGSPYSNPVSANNKGTIYYVVDVDDTRIYYIELSYGRASNETYFTYGDTYEFNENTGKYRIINSDGSPLQIVQYKTNFEELKGKYVSSWSGSTSSSSASKTLENLNTLYKISTNSTSELRKYYRISESTKSISMEKVLSETKDDYGTSYYYRGGVEDNYVNYSGMCWRIVRIDGNGNIKIILADRNNECNSDSYSKDNTLSGFLKLNDYENDEPVVNTYYDNFSDDISLYSDWGISEELNSWVSSSNLDTSKLVTTNWCNDSSYYKKYIEYYDEEWNEIDGSNPDLIYETYITKYYNVDKRLQYKDGLIPTLKCNMMGIENSKSTKVYSNIGLITADEAVFAGAIYVSNYSSNYNYVNYYLLDNASGNSYYTLTPYMETNAYFDKIISVSQGMVSSGEAQGSLGALRPVVVLKNNVQFSGEGTQSNPYVIN